MASDLTAASVYERNTDRPIRPLPKRRLRERLAPDVADSIEYPPAPQSTPALFSYLSNLKGNLEEEAASGTRESPREYPSRQFSRRNGHYDETEPLDEVLLRRTVVPRAPSESLGRHVRQLQKPETSRQGPSPQPPPSAASSADGYDSFENTNNKKKRKIPTAGEMNGGHSLGDHGLNDAHSLPGGLAVTPDRSSEHGSTTSIAYYGSSGSLTSGQNVSGAGRGRFGRSRSARSPLQTLENTGGYIWGRGSKARSATGPLQPAQSTGIISNAIANAEKLTLPDGQENTSLLQQQQSLKPNPASTQFTFTCDSQVPGTLAWPGSDPKSSLAVDGGPTRDNANSRAAHPTATGPSPLHGPPSDSSLRGEASLSVSSERKNRRRAAKDLQSQARKRREDTQRQNTLHPQKIEDMWICEFCEYERIFGHPPVALIRQYEIKDRKIRQQEEERRRVWEKAKARSRKGKKGKMVAKNTNANNHAHTHANDGHQAPSMNNTHSQDTQSEVYDDEEYEEDENYDLHSEPPVLVPIETNRATVPGHRPDGGIGSGGGVGASAVGVEDGGSGT